MSLSQTAQQQHSLGYDHIQGQHPAQSFGAFHLPRFHFADIFEDLMPALDPPPPSIPPNQAASRFIIHSLGEQLFVDLDP